jgi:transposase
VPKLWKFAPEQKTELKALAKTHPKPYVRARSLALYHLAAGKSAQEVADLLLVHRVSVGCWARRYQERGAAGLEVAPGRGRSSAVEAEEVGLYLRQSPRSFGIARTRWTLATLAKVVPAFKGMTNPGVLKALQRCGYAYKRGQPHLHSPDPDYETKKGRWTKL